MNKSKEKIQESVVSVLATLHEELKDPILEMPIYLREITRTSDQKISTDGSTAYFYNQKTFAEYFGMIDGWDVEVHLTCRNENGDKLTPILKINIQ